MCGREMDRGAADALSCRHPDNVLRWICANFSLGTFTMRAKEERACRCRTFTEPVLTKQTGPYYNIFRYTEHAFVLWRYSVMDLTGPAKFGHARRHTHLKPLGDYVKAGSETEPSFARLCLSPTASALKLSAGSPRTVVWKDRDTAMMFPVFPIASGKAFPSYVWCGPRRSDSAEGDSRVTRDPAVLWSGVRANHILASSKMAPRRPRCGDRHRSAYVSDSCKHGPGHPCWLGHNFAPGRASGVRK